MPAISIMANLETSSPASLFRDLVQTGEAIPRIFGLPAVADESGQPVLLAERSHDRLTRLRDGSLLDIHHLSSIDEVDNLARRLAHRFLQSAEKQPEAMLRQVIIFAPVDRLSAERPPITVELDARDNLGHGLRFSAPIRDIRDIPTEIFEQSGDLNDLFLGLFGPGAAIPEYVATVKSRLEQLTGEPRELALEKIVAIWWMSEEVRKSEVLEMSWIEEIKDRPAIQQIVELAGKERIAKERRLALAGVIVDHVRSLAMALPAAPDEIANRIATLADEYLIREMIRAMNRMTDLRDFLCEYGVEFERQEKASWPRNR